MPPTSELLYLSPVVPALTGNGLAMRAGMVLEALAEHHRVSLLVVRLHPSPEARIPAVFRRLCHRTSIVDPAKGSSSFSPALRLVRSRTRPFDQLREAPFDTIHAFRLAMAPYASRFIADRSRRPRLDLDLDDIESRTHRRLASLCRVNDDRARAAFEDRQAELADAAESEALLEFDRIYVCSQADRALIEGRAGGVVAVLPNAVRLPASTAPPPDRGAFRFLFVGTLGYYPNEDAVLWLCREIAPRLRESTRSAIEIDVVGGGASPRLRAETAAAGVNLRGPVSRLSPLYRRASAVLAPIRAGGGTRIKIIEAWSHRRPVVSTSLGAEGLDAGHEQQILLADDPELFCQACLRLMNDRGLAARLVESAHDLFRRRYSPEAMRAAVASFHDAP